MTLKLPALDPSSLPVRNSSGYPEPFRSLVLPREKRALGDACGLTAFGVNLTTLMPGKESSMRHCHKHEDEFIYILEGEVALITNEGEQILTAGMCAGFPADNGDAHHFINRSDKSVRYLEVGARHPEDSAVYPDVDLAYHKDPNGKGVFTRKDGSSF